MRRGPFTPEEEGLAALLQRHAGLPRATARGLVLVARGGAWGSAEAKEAADLSQPDFGAAMRDLLARGAVTQEKDASTGGRPALRYRAAEDAVARALASKRAELEAALAGLAELEARLRG